MTIEEMIDLLTKIRKELDGQPLIMLYDGLYYKVISKNLSDEIEKVEL